MTAPVPPTGPLAEVPTKAKNLYAAYLAWSKTSEGISAYLWIQARALEQLANGAKRISINALVERYRAAFHHKINNTWRAWLADDLVANDPRFLPLIERRRRRKAKVV